MSKKILAILMAAVLLIGGLAACGNKGGNGNFAIPEGGYDGSEVTIKFAHTMGAKLQEVLNYHIDEFNKLYPNIHIEHDSYGGWSDIAGLINTEIMGDNQPNIAYCYPDHVAMYNLFIGQTQGFGGSVCPGYFNGAGDQLVQGSHCVRQIVHRHMVGIAVCQIGLGTHGDLGGDLVADVVIAANLGVFNVDVGIQLVEFNDVGIQHIAKVLTHGVVEGNSHLTAVVTDLGNSKIADNGRLFLFSTLGSLALGFHRLGGFITAAGSQKTCRHQKCQKKCKDSLFHRYSRSFL